MERADSALGPLIKDLGLEDALRLYRIKQSWKEILGEPLAMHAAPTALKSGVLHINISTPAWLQQAGYYKAQILEKLGRLGVSDIRLKLGKIRFSSPPKTLEKLSFKEPDPVLLEELISSIEDGEVKEAARRAARKALGTTHRKSR